MCIERWARESEFELAGATLAVQGFGTVGSHVATTLSRLGTSLVAVGDHTGYWHCPEGFNPFKLAEFVRREGGIAGYPRGEPITREQFFAYDCEILVPAALELQIGSEEAKTIKAQVVAEAANGPVDLEGERILAERGIELLPDILVNSGGVVVSYFEWLQNMRGERWDRETVREKLERRMDGTYERVRRRARELRCDPRTAAYVVALERIRVVYRRRGIWP
jgi:glutamate dehydrogenase (NAD(P)+)